MMYLSKISKGENYFMLSFNKKFLAFPLMICLMLVTLCTFGFAGCSTDKITVTFEANGGYFEIEGETEPKSSYTLEIKKGEKLDLSKLYLPKRDSTSTKVYTFDGWDTDVSQAVAESLTVKASWKEETRMYTVTFDANGGVYTHLSTPTTTVSSEYEYNASISVPSAPVKVADNSYTYEFLGYDATVSNKATQTITYKAQWKQTSIQYTVTFNANGGNINTVSELTNSYQNDGLKYGDKIELPTGYSMVAPESTPAQVFEFAGWYDAASGGNKIVSVSGNTTVYAHWTAKDRLYNVTFNAGNGKFKDNKNTKTIQFKYGAVVSYPFTSSDAPVMDMTETTIYTFRQFNIPEGATVTGDVEYKAEYSQATRMYTVTFNAGEGYFNNSSEKTLTKKFEYNAAITAPEVMPTRQSTDEKAYNFGGYENLTSDSRVTGDGIVFNAQYIESVRQYTVTFFAGQNAYFNTDAGKKSSLEFKFNYGDTVVAPTIEPIKSSTDAYTYTFDRYSNLTDSTKVTGFGMAFTAEYTEADRYYTITFDAGEGYFNITGEDGVVSQSKTVTQQVKYNNLPNEESVATPVRKEDSYATYTFSEWGALSAATADVTYTAQYTPNVKTYVATFYKAQDDDKNPIYTAYYKAATNTAPVLSAEQIEELEQACVKNGVLLADERGFAGKWCFTLRNSSNTFMITGDSGVYKFGNGTEANPYLIDSLAGFDGMMANMDAYYTRYSATEKGSAESSAVITEASSVYYKMIADVDFASYNGKSHPWFIGHLDAKKSDTENYSIKGLDPNKLVDGQCALFAKLFNSEVTNLDILTGKVIAAFGGHGYGSYVIFENVNVRNADGVDSTFITADNNNVSPYMFWFLGDTVSFINCTNSGNYVSEASYNGLFLGGCLRADDKGIFTNCVFDGSIVASDSVGMLVGNGARASKNGATITGCVNRGTITAISFGNFVPKAYQGAWTNEVVAEYEKGIDNTSSTYNELTKINADLDAFDEFTLKAKSETGFSAGRYVFTVTTYAKSPENGTVRVNYSYTKELTETTNSINLGIHYDFIDKAQYTALGYSVDGLEWNYMQGYKIKCAFDEQNKYVVFDFSEFTEYTLVGVVNSKAYLTYYDVEGKLAGAATFAVPAHTRAKVA